MSLNLLNFKDLDKTKIYKVCKTEESSNNIKPLSILSNFNHNSNSNICDNSAPIELLQDFFILTEPKQCETTCETKCCPTNNCEVCVPPAEEWSEYLYWDNTSEEWKVGGGFNDLNRIHIGSEAGRYNQFSQAIAIGYQAGFTNQGSNSIAIGSNAGKFTQSSNAIAIGRNSGFTNQLGGAVAMGSGAGEFTQGGSSVAIGNGAGRCNQKASGVAIGVSAGQVNQGLSSSFANSVAIGVLAGQLTQNIQSVAIGPQAGQCNQGNSSISIGVKFSGGDRDQKTNAISIGTRTAERSQGEFSIAVGRETALNNQGNFAVAIGYRAAFSSAQGANSIIINGTGNPLNNTVSSSCVISPIRTAPVTNTYRTLMWNNVSGEVVCSTNFNDQSKTFVIDHPTESNKYLQHACLEGPEVGVYYRGIGQITNDSETTINLPNYVDKIASDFTVYVTPISHVFYSASKVKDNKFTVIGKNGEFSWLVYGKRHSLIVEPPKSEYTLNGDGPYKYLVKK
jgi:hypothetical protein